MTRSWFVMMGLVAPLLVVACGEDESSSSGSSTSSTGSGMGGGGAGTPTSGAGAGLSLDMSFGESGVAHINEGESTDRFHAAARLADGSMVLGGTTGQPASVSQGLLVRFDSNGALDTSFGQEGHVLLDLGQFANVTDVEPDASGGVYVAGSTVETPPSRTFVMHLDAGGAIDTAFADAGLHLVESDGSRLVVDLVVQADGKLVYLHSTDGEIRLTRLSAAGAVDTAFGSGGSVAMPGISNTSNAEVRALELANDGDLLALVGDGQNHLFRLDPNGTLVTGFGSNGDLVLGFDPASVLHHSSGAIFVGGEGSSGVVLKVDDAGVPDAGFGASGELPAPDGFASVTELAELDSGDVALVEANIGLLSRTFRGMNVITPAGVTQTFDDGFRTTLGFTGEITHVAVDGAELLLAGSREIDAADPLRRTTGSTVVRVDAAGTLIAGYGTDGVATAASGASPDAILALHRDGDGFIMSGGEPGSSGPGFFARADGEALDTTFGTDGFVDVFTATDVVLVDASGRLLSGFATTVQAWGQDGEVDDSFGALQGQVQIPLSGNGGVFDLQLDGEGRVLAMGPHDGGGFVARLLADGSVDTAFGDGGVVYNPAGGQGEILAGHMQSDGKLLVGGNDLLAGSGWVGRMNADGSADAGFGSGGHLALTESVDVTAYAPLDAGGFLAAGFESSCKFSSGECHIFVVRVSEDGQLDTGFGAGGYAKIPVSRQVYRTPPALVALPSGEVVTGSSVPDRGFVGPLALFKLTADGALDTSFGDGGTFTLPGRGRAVSAFVEDGGLLVGGTSTSPGAGQHVVFLRFTLE